MSKSPARIGHDKELPEFAHSPLPKGNYAFVVPRCSEDRKVLVFNIYRDNLFTQKLIMMDGKLRIVAENGSLINDLNKVEKAEDVYLLNKLYEIVHPTFLELYPGKERMLSTIVLIKDKFTADELYLAYDEIKRHIAFQGFSIGFASECTNLFLPEGQNPVQDQTKPPSH